MQSESSSHRSQVHQRSRRNSGQSYKSHLSSFAQSIQSTIKEKSHIIPGFAEADEPDYRCCEQDSVKACLWALTVPLVSNFAKGCAIKFLLELIAKRSLFKVYQRSSRQIPRIGATIGLSAMVFHGVMCFLRRLGKKK